MAEQTVDTILVKIKADMSQLRKELNKTNQMVGKSVQNQKKSFAVLGTSFKTLVTGAVAIASVQAGRSLIGVASDAQEMRDKAKVVFGNFHKDFQDFAKTTAEATGRSAVDIEAMGASIQDLFVPLGFTREAGTELSKTLSQLAIDVGSFNNEQDTSVMRAFQSALIGNHETVRRFGVVIDQATLKEELFSMGITKNIDQVDAKTKVLARMNLLLAGTSDAQGNAVDTAGSFANQTNALRGAIKDLSVEVGTELLPVATTLVTFIRTDIVPALRLFAETVGLAEESLEDKLTEQIGETIGHIERLEKSMQFFSKLPGGSFISNLLGDSDEMLEHQLLLQDLVKQLEDLKKVNEEVSQVNTEVAETTKKKTQEQEQFFTALNEEIASLQRLLDAQRLGEEQLEVEIALQERLQIIKEQGLELGSLEANILDELLQKRQELNKVMEQEADAEEELNDKRKQASDTVDRFKTQQERLTEEIQKFKDLLEEVGIETVPGAEETLRRMEEELEKLNPVVKILEENFERAFDSIAQAIADSMTEGKDAMESFRDIARNILNSLIRDFIRFQMEAIKVRIPDTGGGGSLLSSILGGIGGLFGGGGSSPASVGGSFAGNASQINVGGGAFNTAGGGMVFRAGGGSISRGMPTVVGERGAELFVPNTSGRIVNNANMKGMGGGTTVINQNINVETGVAQTVRAEMLNLLPQFKAETIGAVAESRLRGGEFASAFSGGK